MRSGRDRHAVFATPSVTGTFQVANRLLPVVEVSDRFHVKPLANRLSAGGGLLCRYLHEDSPDGIPGDEGGFVLCSFWLVDNLARQGQLDKASELHASLCARASTLGLLPEQIDPSTGEFSGNFPQAFSHIGVIAAGVTLARADQPVASRPGMQRS
jgi:alpha,alpha-trehalase